MNITKHRVYMIESELGWGSKIDEIKEFDTEAAAIKFARFYNKRYNSAKITPNYYIKAVYEKDMITR